MPLQAALSKHAFRVPSYWKSLLGKWRTERAAVTFNGDVGVSPYLLVMSNAEVQLDTLPTLLGDMRYSGRTMPTSLLRLCTRLQRIEVGTPLVCYADRNGLHFLYARESFCTQLQRR